MDSAAAFARPPRRRGFTLVELLVAIWIMAIVSVIAWRGLSALVATRERLGPEADEVRALLTGFGQMERDLAHATNASLVPAPVPPVSVSVIDGQPALQILRMSEPQPDGGSAVQAVTYAVIDGALTRQCTPPERSVQVALGASPSAVRLVGAVTSIQVRVWRPSEGWVVPPPDDPTPVTGVEVVVNRGDGTSLRRVMVVG